MVDIKSTCTAKLLANTFKEYLHQLFPQKDNTSKLCSKLQSKVCNVTSIRLEKLSAFSSHLFPPITIQSKELLTMNIGDILPQFTVAMNGKKYIYECQICQIVFGSNARGTSLEGVSQLFMHGITASHKQAVDRAAGCLPISIKRPEQSSANLMLRFLGKTQTVRSCEGIWDPLIVNTFANDQYINRMSLRKLFAYQSDNVCLEHTECQIFESWIEKHPERYEKLKKTIIPQAMFVPEEKTVMLNGKEQRIHGCIKSSIPPCDNKPIVTTKSKNNAYNQNVCKPCYIQWKYLKCLQRKRQYAALQCGSRLQTNGMRRSYLNKEELKESAHLENIYKIEKKHRVVRSENEWLTGLEECCRTGNQQKFIIDCLDLFKHQNPHTFEVQLAVLKSIVGQLRSGRNHHYSSIIKRVAKMSKNWLGSNNYSKIQVFFQNYCVKKRICCMLIIQQKRCYFTD